MVAISHKFRLGYSLSADSHSADRRQRFPRGSMKHMGKMIDRVMGVTQHVFGLTSAWCSALAKRPRPRYHTIVHTFPYFHVFCLVFLVLEIVYIVIWLFTFICFHILPLSFVVVFTRFLSLSDNSFLYSKTRVSVSGVSRRSGSGAICSA